MVSKEELEDILHDEEVEARWKSIRGSKKIKKAEADKKYWKDALDPFYDEMFPHTPAKAVSDVVRKEMEEYEKNEPLLAEFEDMLVGVMNRAVGFGIFWFIVGLIFLITIIMYPTEESCSLC